MFVVALRGIRVVHFSFEGCNYSFGTQFPPTLLQPANLEKKIIPTVMGISTVMVYHHSIV